MVISSIFGTLGLGGMNVSGNRQRMNKDLQEINALFKSNLMNKRNLFIKRIFDLTAGSAIFIFSLPLLFLFGILIKLDSRGPVLFIQKRLGKNGKIFNCLKFRTMLQDAEEVLKCLLEKDPTLKIQWEVYLKLKRDPRITCIGRFLRKTCLDELPQIINVLRGEMSLVGPRPRADYELEGRQEDNIFQVGLTVLPGITGLWQVSGKNELNYEQRIRLDADYVANWSLWLDIVLLFRTIAVVIWQKGNIEF